MHFCAAHIAWDTLLSCATSLMLFRWYIVHFHGSVDVKSRVSNVIGLYLTTALTQSATAYLSGSIGMSPHMNMFHDAYLLLYYTDGKEMFVVLLDGQPCQIATVNLNYNARIQ